MKRRYLVASLVLISLIFSSDFVFSQSTPEQLETQKRLNEVESKRTSSATSSSTRNSAAKVSFLEGTISFASNSLLILATDNGAKMIATNDSTKFLNLDSKGKKLIGFGDLKISETIMVLGLSPETGKGTAKLIVRDQNPKIKYFSLLGKIIEVKETTLKIGDYKTPSLDNSDISLSPTTVLKKKSKNLTPDQLTINDSLIVTGSINEKNNLLATDIFILSN